MMLALRLHAQALSEALRKLGQVPLATATAVLVLGLALSLPLLAAMLLRTMTAATSQLDTEPHVNVYLALDASDDDVKRVEQALRAHRDASAVRFIPRSQALEELKATTHLGDLLASLDRNPLPHAFSVRVRGIDPAQVQMAKAEWSKLPKVDQVVADFEWSQRLSRWARFGEQLVTALGTLLALAVLFIVGHLIRLQVLGQKDEIEVSQLIGATAGDVRRPFLYHGALQGALSGLAALGLATGVAFWLDTQLQALTSGYLAEVKVVSFTVQQVAWVTLGAAALGLLGAWIAVSRELRAFARHR
ncbi:MAG: permease-like cell division protein FtsX [Bacillota bacterium]